MKKLIVLVLFLILIMAESVFAATPGTCTITQSTIYVLTQPTRKVITLSWVASVDAATVPSTTITAATYGIGGWYLYSAETNPGTTPTDNYDITITDADGVDIAGGLLLDRDTSTTELVNLGATLFGRSIVRGNLTFALSGNSVNSATGTCILIFVPEAPTTGREIGAKLILPRATVTLAQAGTTFDTVVSSPGARATRYVMECPNMTGNGTSTLSIVDANSVTVYTGAAHPETVNYSIPIDVELVGTYTFRWTLSIATGDVGGVAGYLTVLGL